MKNKDIHKHLDEIEERLNERIEEIQELLTKVALLLADEAAQKRGLCGRFPDSGGFLVESPTEPSEESTT